MEWERLFLRFRQKQTAGLMPDGSQAPANPDASPHTTGHIMKRVFSRTRSESVSSEPDAKDMENTDARYAAESASDRLAASDKVASAKKNKKPKISVTASATEKNGNRLKTHDQSPGSPLRASADEKNSDGANSPWQRSVSALHSSAPTFMVGKDLRVPASASDPAPADQPAETTSPRDDWLARHGQPSFTFDECPIESINAQATAPTSPTREIPAAMATPGKSDHEKRLAAVASEMKALIEMEAASVLKALMTRAGNSEADVKKLDSARAAFSRFIQQFNKAKQEAQNGKAQETASALAKARIVLRSFIEKDYKIIADLIPRDGNAGAGKKEVRKYLSRIESACSRWAEPASAPGNRNRSASSPVSPGRHRTEPGKLQNRPMSVQLPSWNRAQGSSLYTQGLDAQPGGSRATARERDSVPYTPLADSAATGMPLANAPSAPAAGSPLSTDTKPAHTGDTQGTIGTAGTAQESKQKGAGNAAEAARLQELKELDSLVDKWLD
jgi:hypothetical protein